jgi:hypothetical protein
MSEKIDNYTLGRLKQKKGYRRRPTYFIISYLEAIQTGNSNNTRHYFRALFYAFYAQPTLATFYFQSKRLLRFWNVK